MLDTGESRNACKVLIVKAEGRRPLGRSKGKWEKMGRSDLDCSDLAQDRDR